MNSIKFTVFTPTYNRANTILRVYDSLCKQTCKDFEWIVVDDGSADNTKELIYSVMEDSPFLIRYYYQKNSGKHVAQNRAVDMAKGFFFLPLDSDDVIIPESLEILWDTWISISEELRGSLSGVGVHCFDQNGHMVGDPYPQEGMISNDLEMKFIYKVSGEKWGTIRTDIMRQYKNPEVKGHFLSESTMWFRIARKYQKKYINKCVRLYEVHEDSVTKKQGEKKDYNTDSFICSECIFINEFYDWYLKYDKKGAVKRPLALAKRCIENDRNICLGDDSILKMISPIGSFFNCNFFVI